MKKKYIVTLTQPEWQILQAMLSRGKAAARKLMHARILLKADASEGGPDYPSYRQAGYDCGSGPTESFCGTLTMRLKGRGMRWDKDNAEAMMALGSLYYSNLWQNYWAKQRAA